MPRVFCRKRSERLICLLSMCNEPQIDQAVSECECAAEKRGAVSTQVYTDSPDRKQYPFCSIHSDLQSNVHHKKTALSTLSVTFANNSDTIFGTRLTCR